MLRPAGAVLVPASIHAPARGATCQKATCKFTRYRFNPRSRTGSDPCSRSIWTWRACFNPRSRTGSDAQQRLLACAQYELQSTLPHGERPRKASSISIPTMCFNPRSRTGSDKMPDVLQPHRSRFNPRSRTGSDPWSSRWAMPPGRFNPRSRTGSDRIRTPTTSTRTSLQSTLPHGERRNQSLG